MKKRLFAALMLLVLTTLLASTALAAAAGDYIDGKFYFDKVLDCTDNKEMRFVHPDGNWRLKYNGNQRINVYHSCYVGSNALNNFFVPVRDDGVSCGSKWVTPYMEIPIRSDYTLNSHSYNVKARGNTDHMLPQHGSRTSISVFGNYETN